MQPVYIPSLPALSSLEGGLCGLTAVKVWNSAYSITRSRLAALPEKPNRKPNLAPMRQLAARHLVFS